ncbi:hypothetical protein CK203_032308 [Vitis vinifera]|uniref:Reverse transcriptase zinc-binding domain-containing protein n=1 Tax=Vitis vinifera TaxID=29760 RepID=A0A438IJX7_VITVI|nr:hypothetical protein CK203_032308 [Vitis vinifera]
MLEGFRVGRNRTRVSHLQFADDTIFFSNTREEDLQTLKSLLLAFGHISGLKVNLDKSNIYGINLDQAHISRLAETLECKASGWPILSGSSFGWEPQGSRCKNREVAEGFFMVRDWGRQKGSFSQGNGCGGTLERFSSMASGHTKHYGSHSNGWDANTIVRWSHRVLGRLFLKSFRSFPRLLDLCFIPIFGSPQVFPSKFVWNSQIPFKVQSFIWLVAHKKVNTNDMLQVRRPYKALSPDICILCMKHGESADHIFLHCSLTIGLWHRLFQLAKMDWVPPRASLT